MGMTKAPKTLNWLLFLFTLIAGLAWWGTGEIFFSIAKGGFANIIRNPLLNGIYFAFLSAFSIGACLFSENIIHSIVDKDFFKAVVMVPALKIIIPIVFVFMLLAAGVLEFVYELEFAMPKPVTRTQPAKVQRPVQPVNNVVTDYYFLLDNTTSLLDNDPKNERIRLLERIINNFPENRKIALISFGDKATIHIRPTFASEEVKNRFKSVINGLVLINYTNIGGALQSASSILQNETSRREVVILITDGEDNLDQDNNYFREVMNPFINGNVPVHTIFLNPGNTHSNLLRRISDVTGGTYSTVRNPVDLESSVMQAIEAEEEAASELSGTPAARSGSAVPSEQRRDMLAERTGNRQNSPWYALMHIAFITLIGLLMGYFLYTVFSHRDVFLPLLIGGGISGLLAGLVLEFGLQAGFFPVFVIRMFACVILSTVFWLVSFICGRIMKLKNNRNSFAFLGIDYNSTGANILQAETGEKNTGINIVRGAEESGQYDQGTLEGDPNSDPDKREAGKLK